MFGFGSFSFALQQGRLFFLSLSSASEEERAVVSSVCVELRKDTLLQFAGNRVRFFWR